jgi:menaquinone reductase, multiheme cytochrome c subunit
MRGAFPFAAGLAIMLAAGWVGFPRAIYKSRPQPVDFSHKVHADKAGQKCEDCHSFRTDGTFAGIPTLDKCAGCHAAPMGATAAEKIFVEQYVTPVREPQWAVYARQPENVFFSHIVHVKRAQLQCEECHGVHGASDKLAAYQEDRVSGYSRNIWQISERGKTTRASMTMSACVDCHRQHGLEHSCLDCHK